MVVATRLFEFDVEELEFALLPFAVFVDVPASPQPIAKTADANKKQKSALRKLIGILLYKFKFQSIINRTMIDKTYRSEFARAFLIEALPDPLTRSSSHIQIFDNYIAGTRMRIRSVRQPESKTWSWTLEQRFPVGENLAEWKVAEIHLNDAEHAKLDPFEGDEIRKNRYFHEFDSRMFAFDVYLGSLWGLNRAKVEFESLDELQGFEPPPFAIFEVTNEPFFVDYNLVHHDFNDLQAEVARIGANPMAASAPDE